MNKFKLLGIETSCDDTSIAVIEANKDDPKSYDILAFVLIEFINNNFNKYSFNNIIEIVNSQIDENSMHKSYNILEHAKCINNLNEVKNILL